MTEEKRQPTTGETIVGVITLLALVLGGGLSALSYSEGLEGWWIWLAAAGVLCIIIGAVKMGLDGTRALEKAARDD